MPPEAAAHLAEQRVRVHTRGVTSHRRLCQLARAQELP